jgi:hypothetical protein
MKKMIIRIIEGVIVFFSSFSRDRVRFYRHPENKYLYVMMPGKLSNETSFRKIYEDAVEISMSELDKLEKTGIPVVVFEDDPNLSGPQITMPGPEGNEMKFLANAKDAKQFIQRMEK